MAQKYIWLKMTKEWGGFAIGEIVRFGESKGVERAEKGFGIQVAEPAESKKARADAAKRAAKDEAKAAVEEKAKADKVETADIAPEKETAEGNSVAKAKSKK